MNDTSEFDIEFLSQKLADNPSSVLFARLADLYLLKNQASEAKKLCEEGIKNFPRYYAGYLVLGKTHLALKEYSKARSAFAKAQERSPFNRTITSLIQSIPEGPDESEQMTDENYFSDTTASPESSASPEQEIPAGAGEQEGTPVNASLFDSLTQEEMDYVQQTGDVPEQPQQNVADTASGDAPIASFDEYYAQNQQKIDKETTTPLDDYLNTPSANEPQSTPDEPTVAQHEPAGEPVAAPEEPAPQQSPPAVYDISEPTPIQEEPTSQQSAPVAQETAAESAQEEPSVQNEEEPEQVFSSPEQAELYAQMQQPEQSTEPEKNFDALTEKLQNPEKIVPQETTAPQEQEQVQEEQESSTGYGADMVTPTLAEIYASQGEYKAAIQAYEILIFSQPEKGAEYQKRVQELQQLQMKKDGLV